MNITPINNNNYQNAPCKPSFKNNRVFNVAYVQLNGRTISRHREARKYILVIQKAVRELKKGTAPFAKRYWAAVNKPSGKPEEICSGNFHIIEGFSAIELKGMNDAIKKLNGTVQQYQERLDDMISGNTLKFVQPDENGNPRVMEIGIKAFYDDKKSPIIEDVCLVAEGEPLPVETIITKDSQPPKKPRTAWSKREPLNSHPDWPATPPRQNTMPKGDGFLDFG